MEQENRRHEDGDGSSVLLAGEQLDRIENELKKQFPVVFKHWFRDADLAVLS